MTNSPLTPGVVPGRLPAQAYHDNFTDHEPPLDGHEARVAADRCYFCHDAPCMTACPTSIDIPLFIRQIATGNPIGSAKTIFDQNIDRLRYLDQVLHGRVHTLASTRQSVADSVRDADLVIGGVLIAGAKAPRLVTADMISTMRPGSVVVDVAIDQGGCIETSHPTSHTHPTFLVDGVVHYCVTNMPGAVPRTSTLALANATLRYGLELADRGIVRAVERDPALAAGVNVMDGKVTYRAVADAFGMEYTPLADVIAHHAPTMAG